MSRFPQAESTVSFELNPIGDFLNSNGFRLSPVSSTHWENGDYIPNERLRIHWFFLCHGYAATKRTKLMALRIHWQKPRLIKWRVGRSEEWWQYERIVITHLLNSLFPWQVVHVLSGIQKFAEPVSTITENSCAGVPTVILVTKKLSPYWWSWITRDWWLAKVKQFYYHTLGRVAGEF